MIGTRSRIVAHRSSRRDEGILDLRLMDTSKSFDVYLVKLNLQRILLNAYLLIISRFSSVKNRHK